MFQNYILVAVRNMVKQKLFTAINIIGLVIGLTALIVANGLISYEESYDDFFADKDRIFLVAGNIDPQFSRTAKYNTGIPSPVQTLLIENAPDIEYSARLWQMERVARVEDKLFYQDIRFADPDFTNIFKFDYVAGDDVTPLSAPDGLIITESAAKKYFGEKQALGQTITLDSRLDLKVTAVIKDIPRNSHFTSNIGGPQPFEFIANIKVFEDLNNTDLSQRWGSTSSNNLTYVLLPEGLDPDSITPGLMLIKENHQPEDNNFIESYFLMPMTFINLSTWDSVNMPIPQTIRIVGILVLLVAIINYSNLANAQYMGRIREIGLRKSLGSSKQHLFFQFFTESIFISMVALVIALGLIALIIEPMSNLASRDFKMDGLLDTSGLIMLTAIALGTGFLGGIYPAIKISRTPAVACLSDRGIMDGGKGWLRNTVIGLQFGVAIMLASGATIIYAQNQHLNEKSVVFDKYNTLLVDRIGREGVAKNYQTFKEQVLRLPGVINVTASNNVPFEQSSSTNTYSRAQGDEAGEVSLLRIFNDHDFMQTYKISIIAGRDFDENVALDTYLEAVEGEDRQPSVNVILNRMAIEAFGWDSPSDALNGSLYFSTAGSPPIEHRVVGIIDTLNYQGMISQPRPMMFTVRPAAFQTSAIHMTRDNHAETILQVEDIWAELNPEFPIVQRLLDDEFMQIFRVLQGLAGILGGFAVIAVFVAFIGLFGMAAFVTEVRTKELGIRKVLGANVSRLVRLVVYQISIPVLFAIIPASGLAWAGMKLGYLQLFPERLENVIPFIGIASISVLVIAWIIVSYHAWRVAKSNPINALSYE